MPPPDQAVCRAYGREWIKRNAAKAREAMSRWRTAHREEDRANKRDYYARNRERSWLLRPRGHARARSSGSVGTRRIELDRERHPLLSPLQYAEAHRD